MSTAAACGRPIKELAEAAAVLPALAGVTAPGAAAPHAPRVDRIGTAADGASSWAAITAIGVPSLSTGKRQLISVDRQGGRNDLPARHPSINDDGTVVAFESASPDLVAGDTNGVSDVFLRTAQ